MSGVTAGTVVGGKYRLDEPIGQGGMASVWRATHTTLESSVAVKFLETYGSSRDMMARRFLREAKLAANLRHRNVVHILDHGMMDDGQPFMVMELLRGVSLGDRLDGGSPPSTLELFEIAAQLLSGLASVHDAGIVHRDVKPDNVFLVRDADGDYAKLLDFGISRDEDPEGGSRMTSTGAVVGTPLYMSPEQARGLKDLDRRTDLWSVGMLLYEALAGACPFESENMGDVLIRVATEDVPPLGDARPDLPEAAVEVVMRALVRDRDKRWADAREMREALLEAADLLAVGSEERRPSRRYPSRRMKASSRADSDTVLDPAALQPATPEMRARPQRWLGTIGIAVGLLGASAALFLALGGEVRFGTAASQADDENALGARPTPAPTDLATADVDTSDIASTPADSAPADVEPGGLETAEEVGAVEAADVQPPSTPIARAPVRPEGDPGETEPETTSPSPRPRAPRVRPTEETPTTGHSQAPPTRPATRPARPSEGEEGGFLRDLDY